MTTEYLIDETINRLGEKVQRFTESLSPLEQAYMEEILARAGAAKHASSTGYRWKPDPVLAMRVSLRAQ